MTPRMRDFILELLKERRVPDDLRECAERATKISNYAAPPEVGEEIVKDLLDCPRKNRWDA